MQFLKLFSKANFPEMPRTERLMSHDPTVEMSIVDKVGTDGVIYRNNSTQDCYVLEKVLVFSAASGFLVVLIVERGINHPSTQPVEHFAQKPINL